MEGVEVEAGMKVTPALRKKYTLALSFLVGKLFCFH